MTKADVDLDGARLSSDRSRRRLAVRPGGISKQLAFSAGPVFQRIAGSAAALQVNVVGAQRDFLSSWMESVRSRFFNHWRGTPPHLGHTVLLSTATSILHSGESDGMKIRWTANRKIQYRELMKQGTPPKKCCRCRSEKHIRTPSR